MNRLLSRKYTAGIREADVVFKFTAPGSSTSATLPTSPTNYVASIAHVGGTNVLTVTMVDAVQEVDFLSAEIRDNTPDGRYATVGTVSNEGTSTPVSFKIATYTAGGSAANDSADVIMVKMVIRDGSISK